MSTCHMPYPDAKVAACLTVVCGPCKYVAKMNHGITDAFLKSIMPDAVNTLGTDVSRALALPLLWAAFEGGVIINGTFYTNSCHQEIGPIFEIARTVISS